MSVSSRIVITCGEPAGIGPEIVLQGLKKLGAPAAIVVVGSIDHLRSMNADLRLGLDLCTVSPADLGAVHEDGRVHVINVPLPCAVKPGQLDRRNAPHVVECINRGVDLCLQKACSAMVTAPAHKGIINDAGIPFSGHTEYIASRCGAQQPVMMLAGNSLRVCLATTHIPLREVASAITAEQLERIILTMHTDLIQRLHIRNPVIVVCGLNPHAGENGHLGQEEIEIIQPVIETLRARGLMLRGPVPADTAFVQRNLADVDAVLAMYHDQGLPIIKHAGFGEVVNMTLGLPIIRTSVDHGTALHLAGTGTADESSLLRAIHAAINPSAL